MLERLFRLREYGTDLRTSVPAFLTLIGTPLTFSIASGLALGFIAYPAIRVLAGLFVLRYA